MSRLEANRRILENLILLVELYPDTRFGQLLINTGVVDQRFDGRHLVTRDPFHEESSVALARLEQNLKDFP